MCSSGGRLLLLAWAVPLALAATNYSVGLGLGGLPTLPDKNHMVRRGCCAPRRPSLLGPLSPLASWLSFGHVPCALRGSWRLRSLIAAPPLAPLHALWSEGVHAMPARAGCSRVRRAPAPFGCLCAAEVPGCRLPSVAWDELLSIAVRACSAVLVPTPVGRRV